MQLDKALRQRRTIRTFQQKPLNRAEISALIDAARMASCAGNMQRLRYIAVTTPATVNRIFKHTAWGGLVQPRRNPEPGVSAPVAFLALTAPDNTDPILHADAGAAIENLQLKAFETGIGCCWIGSYKKPEVAEILDIPAAELMYLVALGYPAESPVNEDIEADGSPRYYLDSNNVLHVPKFTVDAITRWC